MWLKKICIFRPIQKKIVIINYKNFDLKSLFGHITNHKVKQPMKLFHATSRDGFVFC